MSNHIHVDESASFEKTLDEQYLLWHNHQTYIPKGLTGELQRADLKATGRTPPNGMPANWNQDGGNYPQIVGGGISLGCVITSLAIGFVIALLILAVGI